MRDWIFPEDLPLLKFIESEFGRLVDNYNDYVDFWILENKFLLIFN